MKKLLSIILAAAMALSLMCSSLNAAEIDQPELQTDLPEISDNSEPTESDSENELGKVTDSVIGTDEESDAGTEQEPIADEQGSDAEAEQENAGEPPTSEEIAPPMLMATAEDNSVGVTNGQCGDAAYWDYDPDTQTLTISGAGDMWDFNRFGDTWSSRVNLPWDSEEFVISNLVISEGITSIGANAFCGAYGTKADYEFTSLVLPSTITKIGNNAFDSNDALKSVTLSGNLSDLDYDIFEDCKNLSTVIMPDTLSIIGKSMFYGCSSLTNVKLPAGLTKIGNYAFQYCSLTEIEFPGLLNEIGDCAFAGNDLTRVYIPANVKKIGTEAFSSNRMNTEVIFEDGITEIGSFAFDNNTSLSAVKLPDTLTSIQYGLFYGCKSLNTLTIPDVVESISDKAFRGSPNQIVTFEGNAPTMYEYIYTLDEDIGSFDLTDTLIYGAENAAIWTDSANFDPLYNTYCGYKTEVQGVCNHSGSKYVYDQNGHALVCDVCGRGFAMSEHSYGPDNKCICGYTYHEHSWEWQADEYSHYKVCTLCGQTLESGLHKLSSSECLCTECGQQVHIYDYSGHNDEAHWKVCGRCDEQYDYETHTFDNNRYYQFNNNGHYRKCDNCGYIDKSELFPHTSKNEVCVNTEIMNRYGHYYECDDCGYAYLVPHEARFVNDYSGFVGSDILGLPEDKAAQILKEQFGEENVVFGSNIYSGDYYEVNINMCDTKCVKCGMTSGMPTASFYITVRLENGVVSSVDNSLYCYAYSSETQETVDVLTDLSHCPMTTDNLPYKISLPDLKKYAAAGTATFNGVTYEVKAEEVDCLWTETEGAKQYYYDFYCDDYYGHYYVSNFRYIFDSSTMTGHYELEEIDENQIVRNSSVYAIKKFTPGDVNNDGKVTLDDAVLTLKKTMNVDLGSATFIAEAAELTGDNRLSLDDAIGVLKLAMKVQ